MYGYLPAYTIEKHTQQWSFYIPYIEWLRLWDLIGMIKSLLSRR